MMRGLRRRRHAWHHVLNHESNQRRGWHHNSGLPEFCTIELPALGRYGRPEPLAWNGGAPLSDQWYDPDRVEPDDPAP
jgi:hypothetical protein